MKPHEDISQKLDSMKTPEEKSESKETDEEMCQRLEEASWYKDVSHKMDSMKTLEDIDEILGDLKAVQLIRVLGGTPKERLDELHRQTIFIGHWCVTRTTDTEAVTWMLNSLRGAFEIEWDVIRKVTDLGTKLKHPNAKVITLLHSKDISQNLDLLKIPEEKLDSTETDEERYQRLQARCPKDVSHKLDSMKTLEDIDEILRDLKLVNLVRVRGGTAERRDESATCEYGDGGWYIIQRTDTEVARQLLTHDCLEAKYLDWDVICKITDRGCELGHPDTNKSTLLDID